MNNQKRSRLLFSIIFSSFFGIVFLFGIFTYKLVPLYNSIFQPWLSKQNVNCDCVHHISLLVRDPFIGGFTLLIGFLVLSFIIYVVVIMIRKIVVTKKYSENLLQERVKKSQKLNEVASSINISKKVIEIDSANFDIFCIGFINPRIYVSSRLAKQVSKSQLRAILLHEKNHLKSYDPLRLSVAQVIRKSLFFIPSIKLVTEKFEESVELAADERATNNFTNIKSLGNALIKLVSLHKHSNKIENSSIAITSLSITEKRIERLLNHHKINKLKWFTPRFAISFIIVIVFSTIVFNSNLLLANASESTNAALNSTSESCSMEVANDECSYTHSSCNSNTSVIMSCAESYGESI